MKALKFIALLFTLAAVAMAMAALTGCMMPRYTRLIPENKSAHIKIYNPVYGYIEIDTRVPDAGQPLPPLGELPGPVVETVDPGYALVRPAKDLGGGISEPALYRKVGDSENLYMRALGSDLWLRVPRK